MTRFLQAIFLALTFTFISLNSAKADIVSYDFEVGSLAAASTDSLVSATAISDTSLFTFNLNDTLNYPSDVLQVSSPGGNTNAADVVANDHYFSFTVTPDSGASINLSSLDFEAARGGGASPRGWVVRSSVDGFATDLDSADIDTQRPTLTSYSVDLTSPSFDNLTSAVEFRIYTYSPNEFNSVEYDNFVLNGTTAAVPEPSGVVTFLLALGVLTRRRR